jgi:hypothetical protein
MLLRAFLQRPKPAKPKLKPVDSHKNNMLALAKIACGADRVSSPTVTREIAC